MPRLEDLIAADVPALTEIRHDLHAHPELGYQEVRTSGVVQKTLAEAGIEFQAGLAGGTGVLGFLSATGEAKGTVALRADMDALPIFENTGRAYASACEGVMHACGHDGHTTMLLGAARALARLEERPNHVLFIFQPAEEGGAGGKRMCEDGVLAGKVLGPKADMIFGLHCAPDLPLGFLGTRVGPFMASATELKFRVTGKGGHAAYPHTGIDPVVVSAHLILALQTIASRGVDPLDAVVVTVATARAGQAHNVIPDFVDLGGTIRTLRDETLEFAKRRIHEIAAGVASAFGAKIEVMMGEGYPVTVNHPDAEARLRRALGPDVEEVVPVMGAEDFSFYGHHVPACFYWLGINGSDQPYPNLHAAEFDFNDAAIPYGVTAMCRLALS